MTFDDRGNPIWGAADDVLRRREDDNTLDLLEALENDSLSLEEGK